MGAVGDSSSSSRPPRRAKSPATWAPTTSSSRPAGTSATCPGPPPTCRRSTSPSRGPGWASTSTHDFEPLYIISPEKKSTVTELKGLLKNVDELYLATDGDREGEAIAWHLLRDPEAAHPGQADGVPRDHRAGDPRGRRAPPRPGHRPGRRAGDPPHPRPAVRLRGQPGAVEEGRAQAVGRPGPVGGHPHHRAARTRPHGVPQRRLLGRRRRAGRQRVRPAGPAADVHRPAGQASTAGGWPPAATSTRWGGCATGAASRHEVLVLDEAGQPSWPRRCGARS